MPKAAPAMTGAAHLDRPPCSSAATRVGAAEHGVDIDEIIGYRRGHDVLRNVALGAEEAARRHRGEELAVAVHEVGDADHRRLRFAGAGACVARQAFVAVDIYLVAV